MTLNMLARSALVGGLLAGMVGCAAGGPAATAPAQQSTGGGDRQVLSLGTGEVTSLEEARALVGELPPRISEADAKGLLVTIDASQVHQAYGVQQVSPWQYSGWPRAYALYNRFSFLPYRGYYFPYTYASGYYSPYTYGGYAGTYYPYLIPWNRGRGFYPNRWLI